MKLQKLIYNIKNTSNLNIKNQNYQLFLNLGEYLNVLQKIKINQYIFFKNSFLKKRNPFFLIRKNFKLYFKTILKCKTLTPNLLKFLHLTFFPKNIENYWKSYFPSNILELTKLKYQKQLFISINDFSYIFSLIYKNNYIKNIFYFNVNNKPYYNTFKYLYFLLSSNVNNSLPLKNSNFLFINREKENFNKFLILSFKQRNFLQKIIQFYYPLLSFLIKEKAVHSLPMKTKKQKRI
jgi:hypothetical protein